MEPRLLISGGRARKHDSFERRQRRHCLALGFNNLDSLAETKKDSPLICEVGTEVGLMARLAPYPPSYSDSVNGIADRVIPPIDRAISRKSEYS